MVDGGDDMMNVQIGAATRTYRHCRQETNKHHIRAADYLLQITTIQKHKQPIIKVPIQWLLRLLLLLTSSLFVAIITMVGNSANSCLARCSFLGDMMMLLGPIHTPSLAAKDADAYPRT